MYKIKELAKLSGVSTRTLRYYNQIELLMPEKIDCNGYRIYTQKQIDILQQILFYRELDFSLNEIKTILSSSNFDREKALQEHLIALQDKKSQIEKLIENVTKTISQEKEGITMTNEEKFEGFKKSKIAENEKQYGKEIREKYGDEVIDTTNKKVEDMTKDEWNNSKELEELILIKLEKAVKLYEPSSEFAQEICDLHRQWLCMFWKDGLYSKQTHKALVQGYLSDERFVKYYDKVGKGATQFLYDAITIYCK